jgi:thioredoxin 1
MKKRIFSTLGVCYVCFALVMASGSATNSLHKSGSVPGQENYLEQENYGGDRHSQRLFGHEGLQRGPERYDPRDDGRYARLPDRQIAQGAKTQKTGEPVIDDPMKDFAPNCLVMWTADWCSACKKMYPIIQQLRQEGYTVYILDYDKYSELARKLEIKALPTTLILKDGLIIVRQSGVISARTIKKVLRKNDGIGYVLW